MKDKKYITTIPQNFRWIYSRSNKKWVDKRSEFYNRSIKSWSQDNDIEIYSTHNEEKSVMVEWFIRNSKNKIYRYMASISKILYIDKLDNMVNKYNNTYHSTIKMKPVDVKSSTFIDLSKKNNKNKTPKYKNIFTKGYIPNWSEVFVIDKLCIE